MSLDQLVPSSTQTITLDDTGNCVDIHDNPVSATADEIKELLSYAEQHAQQSPIRVFNKLYLIPRKQLMVGGDYTYTGNPVPTAPKDAQVPALINRVVRWANKTYPAKKGKIPEFDRALVNLYRTGNDCIGYHGDDEGPLVKGEPIISVMFGDGVRKFRIKRAGKGIKERSRAIDEKSGMAIVMRGPTFQKKFHHSVPKSKRIMSARVSITLRRHRK